MKTITNINLIVITMLLPIAAQAYVGPGGGLTAIGSIIAFLGAILLVILGFFWYPIKRLINHLRKKQVEEDNSRLEKNEAD